MSLGFEDIDLEIPNTSFLIKDLVKEVNYTEEKLINLLEAGLNQIPINIENTLDNLINNIIERMYKKNPGFNSRIQGIILAHSLPFLSPANISFFDRCTKSIDFGNAFRIAVSGQPCAILHQALQLAIMWLSNAPNDSAILLIGADQAYSIQERLFFNSVMGDAVFAGIISNSAKSNVILSSVTETEIVACEGEMSHKTDMEVFRSKNPMHIRHCIETALEKAGITLSDIHYIIPHTPYRGMGDLISTILRIPREKILDEYIADTGHLNSNDSFCHYVRACKEKKLNANNIVVLINPGFGGSRGCTIIKV